MLPSTSCTWVGNTLQRRPHCGMYIHNNLSAYANYMIGFDHPQGQGKVIHQKCQVRFDIYIPVDIQRTPFYIIRAQGQHTHPPPLPTRLPQKIRDDITHAINAMDLMSLTTRKYCICTTYASDILKFI
jgi:hypothetical protein